MLKRRRLIREDHTIAAGVRAVATLSAVVGPVGGIADAKGAAGGDSLSNERHCFAPIAGVSLLVLTITLTEAMTAGP